MAGLVAAAVFFGVFFGGCIRLIKTTCMIMPVVSFCSCSSEALRTSVYGISMEQYHEKSLMLRATIPRPANEGSHLDPSPNLPCLVVPFSSPH